jgi:two-component system chemotaxis sensor kinase CheA
MKIDLSQFRQTFMQESADHLSTMESGLLDLRSTPGDIELLNAVFRSAHSIKGGAGSFGLTKLVRFTHALENLLDRLRSSEMTATEEVISLMLDSVDVLRGLLEAGEDGATPPGTAELVEQIEALVSGDAAPPAATKERAPDSNPSSTRELHLYRVEFRPGREMFSSGANPLVLLRNLAALGTVSVCELHDEDLPPLAELDPAQCYLGWTVELASSCPESELREVFEFVEHLAEVRIESAAAPATETALALASAQRKSLSTAPTSRVKAVPVPALSTPAKQEATSRKPASTGESSSIRVATDKVDRLIDLVGELVIAHVMAAQMVEEFTPECLPKLREAVATMERNTRELHERVMAVRMLPIGTLFQRYVRTVYDIAKSTGKQIRLESDGEETEIDKSMLELLGDPLTHLIRNAADHGIEAPEARMAAGKPEEGTIHLRAFHRSGRVVIEVADDGAGIDPERVRAKAIERGLIAADAQLGDDQLRMLIFEAGFSTREQVSDLSGRGVGMDVVKRNIQQLNGAVTLTSEKGRGSTVSIELPLTLAILEGLLVRVGDRTLVLPLLSVIETVSPVAGQVVRVAEQGEVVVIREESIPLLRLQRFLGLTETGVASTPNLCESAVQRSLVVVVEAGGKKIGLVVDELLGQQQVVVKSLERHLRKIDGLMGATILGDGCVAPIVDVAALANMNLFALQAAQADPWGHGRGALLTATASPMGTQREAQAVALI